jgi:hypothetical protein
VSLHEVDCSLFVNITPFLPKKGNFSINEVQFILR